MLVGLKPSDTGGPAGSPGPPQGCGHPHLKGAVQKRGCSASGSSIRARCTPALGVSTWGWEIVGGSSPERRWVWVHSGPETYIHEPRSHVNGLHRGVTLSPPASYQPRTREAAPRGQDRRFHAMFSFPHFASGCQEKLSHTATQSVPWETSD